METDLTNTPEAKKEEEPFMQSEEQNLLFSKARKLILHQIDK
jgi:hypothetical protein